MKNKIKDTSSAGVGIIDPCNINFNELYNAPGCKIQRFVAKAISSNCYKDETLRIAIWGDSLLNSYKDSFKLLLQTIYFDKTIEFKDVHQGGTGSNYHISMMWEIINWNPDLIICFEHEGFGFQADFEDTIFKLIKQKTSSDLILVPWSITQSDMELIYNRDLESWRESDSYKIRQWFWSKAAKYDAQIIDWNQFAIEDLYNNTITPAELHIDEIHLSETFYEDYATPAMELNFADIYNLPNQINHKSDWFKSVNFSDAVFLPDLTELTKSGTWSGIAVTVDKTANGLRSSEEGAYIESNFDGIGFELSYFGGHIGQIGVLIDGVATNTLLKDYATSPNSNMVGAYKVIVDSNILSNSETSRQFRITMLSATTFSVTDVTNSTVVLASGSISADQTFSVTGGQLTIPANYANITNWRGTITTGNTFTFYVKKNWYNTIDVIANNLTNTVRIFGLERGNHTVKLTCNSGTITLDSLTEFK